MIGDRNTRDYGSAAHVKLARSPSRYAPPVNAATPQAGLLAQLDDRAIVALRAGPARAVLVETSVRERAGVA